jgi:hypothetical protein
MAKASSKNSPGGSRRPFEVTFEQGDKVKARREAEQVLLAGSASEQDLAAARNILERLRIEPTMWRYAAFAAAIIVVLAVVGF